jgi:hypothetical protein
MKYKKIILFIICYTFFYTNVIGQNLTITLEILDNNIYNIEPLFYKVQIQNNSEIIQESDVFLGSCRLLEIYNPISDEWNNLTYSEKTNQLRFNPTANHGFRSGIKPRKYYIKPQQKFINQFVYFPFEGDFYSHFDYLFGDNDTIRVRSICKIDESSNDKIISNEVKIIIKKDESEVIKYLTKKQIPHFLFEPILFQSFQGYFFMYEESIYVEEAKYILENYPNSKFAAWADLHLAWNDYLAADKNLSEAKYGLTQDSTVALNEAKMQIINAETHLEGALASNNILVHPYAKKLYYSIIDIKMSLGMYATIEEYFNATEYVESL